MQKCAVITGVSGQDGSYLAELLLDKGYDVVGVDRRRIEPEGRRLIWPILNHPNFTLVEGDITDPSFIFRLVSEYQPEEYYNLAAMSHVGQSFTQPIQSMEVTGLGCLYPLEAIRQTSRDTRFYQASTSELFGGLNCPKEGYDEESPLDPRSPYAIAKEAAYRYVRLYRESYDLFACQGILFNHECLSPLTPLVVSAYTPGDIDIVRVKDLLAYDGKEDTRQSCGRVWDGSEWVSLNAITVRPVDGSNPDHQGQITNARIGVVETTRHHKLIDHEGEKHRADEFRVGSRVLSGKYPKTELADYCAVSLEEAELLGLLAGDGHIARVGHRARVCNKDPEIISRVQELWHRICLQGTRVSKQYESGYGGISQYIELLGVTFWPWPRPSCSGTRETLRDDLYNSDGYKKVPKQILNSSVEAQEAFLNGYNMADGLKSNPCTYKYKNFKTNSSQLAQGLLLLVSNVTGQDFNVTYETGPNGNYYSINLLSPTDNVEKEKVVQTLLDSGMPKRTIARETGISRGFIKKIANGGHACSSHHLRRNPTEVKKLEETEFDYVYDIETGSGKFMAGVGSMVIANSPRRGIDFVTRKITDGVAKIKTGQATHITLGNLDAYRDWGHAEDYVRAQWMMLQHHTPTDYVVATGISYSVCDFLEVSFKKVGMGTDYEKYVLQDERFMRPSDVPYLKGNPSRIQEELCWQKKHTFDSMVEDMVQADILRNM